MVGLDWSKGHGGVWVVCRVVWSRWWAHGYRTGKTWSHEIRSGQRLASVVTACGEGKRSCWTVSSADRGIIRIVSYAAALWIWTAQKCLTIAGTFESRRGLSVLLTSAIGRGDKTKGCSSACCWRTWTLARWDVAGWGAVEIKTL